MENTLNGKKLYGRLITNKGRMIVLLILGILLSFVVNLFVGSAGLSIGQTLKTLFSQTDRVNQTIVWDIRMPLALSAILVGVGLGIGGAEMQTILSNPMASPYTLGISSAASFGAALAILLRLKVHPLVDSILVSLSAFVWAMGTSFLIFGLSKRYKWNRSLLILFGIAMSFLFGSMTSFLQYIANENDLQAFVFWSFGDLTKISWDQVFILLVLVLVVYLLFFRKSWALTAMTLGDTNAMSLGIDVKKLRRQTLILISILSATCVAFAGTIGFIGMVAPHMARMICGEDQRYFLPVSALVGALVLSVASILSRTLVTGVLLPIGLVTSMVGIPFFIYLILKPRGGLT
ncbi:MAG: iron ABC transporter permease [Tissierellia bacterium]|nr:iron ABC transporter permease [Tissierellia bacterium]